MPAIRKKTGRDFCLIRSYLYTCIEHGISAGEALMTALSGRLPDFMQIEVADLPELWSPPEPPDSGEASSAEEDKAA